MADSAGAEVCAFCKRGSVVTRSRRADVPSMDESRIHPVQGDDPDGRLRAMRSQELGRSSRGADRGSGTARAGQAPMMRGGTEHSARPADIDADMAAHAGSRAGNLSTSDQGRADRVAQATAIDLATFRSAIAFGPGSSSSSPSFSSSPRVRAADVALPAARHRRGADIRSAHGGSAQREAHEIGPGVAMGLGLIAFSRVRAVERRMPSFRRLRRAATRSPPPRSAAAPPTTGRLLRQPGDRSALDLCRTENDGEQRCRVRMFERSAALRPPSTTSSARHPRRLGYHRPY